MRPYYEADGIAIYNGDCRDVLPGLSEAHLVLTDPPYGVSVACASVAMPPGKGVRSLDFGFDRDWVGSRRLAVEGLSACLSLDGLPSFYVWTGHRCFGDVVDLFEACGLSTRFLVWAKKCPPPAPPGSGWGSAAELCVYAYRPGRTWNGPRDATLPNVLTADSYRHGQPGKWPHPTQKPFAVVRPLLENSSNPGEMVLDPFMGLGTTLVAAKDAGRKAIGIEIEERYCEIAAERLSQAVLPLA